jgi:hypothetical protein
MPVSRNGKAVTKSGLWTWRQSTSNKILTNKSEVVVHVYNPSNLGGRRIVCSRPAQTQSVRPCLKNQSTGMWLKWYRGYLACMTP